MMNVVITIELLLNFIRVSYAVHSICRIIASLSNICTLVSIGRVCFGNVLKTFYILD